MMLAHRELNKPEATNYKAAWEDLEKFLALAVSTMIQSKVDPIAVKRVQILQGEMESIKERNTKESKKFSNGVNGSHNNEEPFDPRD